MYKYEAYHSHSLVWTAACDGRRVQLVQRSMRGQRHLQNSRNTRCRLSKLLGTCSRLIRTKWAAVVLRRYRVIPETRRRIVNVKCADIAAKVFAHT